MKLRGLFGFTVCWCVGFNISSAADRVPRITEYSGSEPQVLALRVLTPSESKAHKQNLLTNFTVYGLARPGNKYGYVPTNTVAIRNYALTELLKLANNVNRAWSFGLPDEITADHVTRLAMLPKTNGFSASITVLARYAFAYSDGKFGVLPI
jgi:hypothetical protein